MEGRLLWLASIAEYCRATLVADGGRKSEAERAFSRPNSD